MTAPIIVLGILWLILGVILFTAIVWLSGYPAAKWQRSPGSGSASAEGSPRPPSVAAPEVAPLGAHDVGGGAGHGQSAPPAGDHGGDR